MAAYHLNQPAAASHWICRASLATSNTIEEKTLAVNLNMNIFLFKSQDSYLPQILPEKSGHSNDLGFAKSARIHQNLLDHKARENSTLEVRDFAGDY